MTMTSSRFVTFLLLLVCFSATARAQAVLPEKGREGGVRENVFGLGLAGGAATGVGISFRHHLPGSWSYQITGGIIKVDEKRSYAVGAEGQYDLIRAAASRFFVVGGFGYYYSGTGNGNTMEGPARISLGVGGEIPLVGAFHISGELLFTYFSDGTVLPLPQVGMYYYFY